ncbi:MAG TPA: N-acetyl-gamma-glutamyl-phosphate reductase [Candidatus Latescibacteria bacterium]|nr:N-acetyl-gamma-glutamyl-phosphate reductase [Candidatus Latescibacterota bacterium]
MIEVGVIGATGYTGIELFWLLARHPDIKVAFVTSETYAGKFFSDVCPELKGFGDIVLDPLSGISTRHVDLVFCCLPHGTSMSEVPSFLERGIKVIDLSADFRLSSAESYSAWYEVRHSAPQLLKEAVYGLPEVNRDTISEASLVATPGCYPTSVILALVPLLERDLIDETGIIVDSKSGVSGAGRKPSLRTHFVETNENFLPYSPGHTHRHIGEMEEQLSKLSGRECRIVFTPHIVPMNRGILSTIYVKLMHDLGQEEIRQIFKDHYAKEPFIRVLEGTLPETRFVEGTNFCDIAVIKVEGTGTLIIFSAIDNLLKGASGQAVQNMNIMFDLEETTGLAPFKLIQ